MVCAYCGKETPDTELSAPIEQLWNDDGTKPDAPVKWKCLVCEGKTPEQIAEFREMMARLEAEDMS